MKIIITGAFGYIGSKLTEDIRLFFPGTELVLIDNLDAAHAVDYASRSQTNHFIKGSILDLNLERIFEGADFVIHLAALSNPAQSFKEPEKTHEINFEGTRRVAEACARSEAALLFPSTTSLYGKMSGSVREDCPDLDLCAQTPYAESKLKAGKYLLNNGKNMGLRFSIVRCGTVFGPAPSIHFHTVVNKFCRQALSGEPLTVWKTAWNQTRPYLDIRDAVSTVIFMVQTHLFDERVYNVATLNTSLQEVVTVLKHFVPHLQLELTDSPAMNDFSYAADCSRLKNAGVLFRGNLYSGIEETLVRINGNSFQYLPPNPVAAWNT